MAYSDFLRNLYMPKPLRIPPYGETLFGPGSESNRTLQNIDITPSEPLFKPQPPSQEEPQDDLSDILKQYLNRPRPDRAAYSDYIQRGYPDPNDYKPGKMTRLAAILSGAAAGFQQPASGYQVAQSIIQAPYERAVRQYSLEGQRLKEAAALEEARSKDDIATIDKIMDNRRQDLNTQSQIQRRNVQNMVSQVGLQEAQARLKLLGIETHIDPTDGELKWVNKLTNQTGSYGKIGASTADRVSEQESKDIAQGKVTLKNQKVMEGIRETFEKGQQEDRQAHDIVMEDKRQTGRVSLSKEKAQEAAARDAARVGIKTVNEHNRLMKNRDAVNAIVDSNKGKYSKYWIDGGKGYNVLADSPAVDDPDYNTWRELYNALYAGTSALGKSIGKYTVGGLK